MKLLERGSGRPRVAVVGGIHGDEPSGVAVVERLDDRLDDPGGTVQLLVANEPALDAGVRYTDSDLNRSFPGDPGADDYERALAARVVDVLDGADAVLALHASRSVPPPFAIYSGLTGSVRRSVTAMPVEYAVDASELASTTLDSVLPHAVSLEAGPQGSDQAVEFGTRAALSFLRAHGLLRDEPPTFSGVRRVRAIEEVPKGGGEPHVHYRNFEEIPESEVFAHDDVHTHRVTDEGRVPVLASERGYEDIFGMLGEFDGTIHPPDDA